MKKIMKKVMSLALVVMMVASLLPMTVFANTLGTESNHDTLSASESKDVTVQPYDYTNATLYFFDWTFEGNQTIEITCTDPSVAFGYAVFSEGNARPVYYNTGDPVDGKLVISVAAVAEACEMYSVEPTHFVIQSYAEAAQEYTVELVNAATTAGTENNHDTLSVGTAKDVTVQPYDYTNATLYFFDWTFEGNQTIEITCTDPSVAFGYAVFSEGNNRPVYYSSTDPVDGKLVISVAAVDEACEMYEVEPTYFVIQSYAEAAQEYTVELVTNTTGGGDYENTNSYSNPEVITGVGIIPLEVVPETSYWVEWVASADGVVTLAIEVEGGFLGVDMVNGSYFYDAVVESDMETSVLVSEGDEVLFYVYPNNNTEINVYVMFDEDGTLAPAEPDGTYENPFIISALGEYTATCNYDNIFYKWEATGDGVLTVTGQSVYAYELNGTPLSNTSTTTEVEEGDVVIIKAYSSTSVDFTVAFEEGAEKEEGPTTKPESNAGADSYTALTAGNVTLMDSVITTILEFTPDKVGTYTITAPSGVLVENWGTSFFPNNTTVNATNSLVVDCTSVGQSCLVGFTAAEGTSTIAVSITYKAAEVKEEVEWTVYENTVTPEKFEIVLDKLEYVDVEDKEVDKAVLGKDGFYHLNAANGPILYVDLNDELMSLFGAADLGKVVEYITENGEVVAKINYNDAVKEYYAAANKDGLYPLTADLMTIYKNAGTYAGWYGEEGHLGFTEDDAWMFACYYVPGSEDKEADNTVVAPLPAPEEGKDLVVDKEDLDEYIEQAVQSGAPLELPTTNENVTMTFDPNELAENDEIVLNLTVNVVDDAKDETVAKNDKITDKNFVLKVEFSHEGKLPAEAVISIQIPAAIAEKYEKLFYYQIMADGSLKFVCDAPVVDGVAKVTQDHCSDYVLLTEKLVDVPGTGDSTNVALWFAVLALGAAAIAGSVVMRKKEF